MDVMHPEMQAQLRADEAKRAESAPTPAPAPVPAQPDPWAERDRVAANRELRTREYGLPRDSMHAGYNAPYRNNW